MSYIKDNNQGIIVLIKKDGKYEFNAIDSSYCVLNDYSKEIENGEYFEWIKDTKFEIELMKKDFVELRNSQNEQALEKYLIWERPNIYIDFDDNLLVNFYYDRAFEDMVPEKWKSVYANNFEILLEYIPEELRYWK